MKIETAKITQAEHMVNCGNVVIISEVPYVLCRNLHGYLLFSLEDGNRFQDEVIPFCDGYHRIPLTTLISSIGRRVTPVDATVTIGQK